jgi:hypothetical protein
MSLLIENSFVNQYVQEVHAASQQRGSKLRNCVRLQTGVTGGTAVFQKNGKGSAGRKTRHGNVPVMNVAHSTVSCTLEDWYGADYVDRLDELKFKQDERAVVANAGAWALGRKIDELLLARMAESENAVEAAAAGLTKAKILEAFARLNSADVPDDGQRFAVVGARQWNELLDISEFKSADYAGDRFPWLQGAESRLWLSITWLFHSGLPLAEGVRTCFVWQEKAAHLVDHMLSAGACLIDAEGVVAVACQDEDAAE